MNTNINTIKNCKLFAGIKEDELKEMFECLNARTIEFRKDEMLFSAGNKLDQIGIILSGSVYIVQEDYWGNRTILTAIEASGLFGEAFACVDASILPISVLAHENGSAMLIDCKRLMTTCSSSCAFHANLIRNLMRILADKNITLTRKMEHITKKSTRDKVLSYLSEYAINAGSNTFTIPFNRQELADYLSVERSALSNTLSKMRDDGLIWYDKNKFTLKG